MELATALPSSVLQAAITNQAGFASEIGSSISAGKTPDWYEALPTDVKSVLASVYPMPKETAASSTDASSAAVATTAYSAAATTPAPSGTGASSIGGNSTTVSTVSKPTLSGTPSPSAGENVTGAASLPSAALGAGIAAVVGFVGLLAL